MQKAGALVLGWGALWLWFTPCDRLRRAVQARVWAHKRHDLVR